MLVKLHVYNVRTGEHVREHTVKWLDANSIQWLQRLGSWAFKTGHGIQVLNPQDDLNHAPAPPQITAPDQPET